MRRLFAQRGNGTLNATQRPLAKDWPKGRFKLKLKPGETKDLGTITVGLKAFK
jgi:hypothetical protein